MCFLEQKLDQGVEGGFDSLAMQDIGLHVAAESS